MIHLTIPEFDYNDIELVKKLVAERQNGSNKDYFSQIEDLWKERVQLYIDNNGNPEIITPWDNLEDPKDHIKFKNLYLSPSEGSVQKAIIDKLRERELKLCPACGEDGTPNTLDHYLPKDIFPEFSVTISNLFPMCDICQGKKGVKLIDANGKRYFMHPYFDSFTEQQLLILVITEPYNAPSSIMLIPNPGLAVPLQQLVNSHMDELHIPLRYRSYFKTMYIRLLRLARKLRENNQNVTDNLNTFKYMASTKSINSWDYLFYDGVLRNELLLNYLSYEELPVL